VSTLVARTRRVDRDIDLLAVAGADGYLFERGRTGLAGRGAAMRVAVADGAEALAAIEVDDEVGLPGCGAVSFGALPFDPMRAGDGELVVPAIVAGRADDGTRWVTHIGAGTGTGDVDIEAPSPPGAAAPRVFTVTASRPAAEWCDVVALATKAMAEGSLEKVVLAREVVVEADQALDTVAVLNRLRAAYPGCYVLSIGGLVGASPELLVSRAGDVVRSHPMAGTAPRGGDPTADARLAATLLASAKDRHEHQITIDMVHDTLLPWCSYVDYEAEPSIVAVANVQHLATLVEGRLSSPAPSVLELVVALHPTPAVAGWPRAHAVAFIAAHEELDRRRYAGAAGWVDSRGNGTWAVAIRSAEIEGSVARVYAGNGIVADSDPRIELAETQAKLQAMLGAIVRP
jgi:menaquinone-specific isochorismate synthase